MQGAVVREVVGPAPSLTESNRCFFKPVAGTALVVEARANRSLRSVWHRGRILLRVGLVPCGVGGHPVKANLGNVTDCAQWAGANTMAKFALLPIGRGGRWIDKGCKRATGTVAQLC